jgi:hypothetical protein
MDFKSKAEQINLVLSEPDVDLWKLRELALTEGGLVNGTFPYLSRYGIYCMQCASSNSCARESAYGKNHFDCLYLTFLSPFCTTLYHH